MSDHEEIMHALGRMEGKMEGIETNQAVHSKALTKIDTRVRNVEIRSAKTGALAGGIMGIGVSLVVASIKESFKAGGA